MCVFIIVLAPNVTSLNQSLISWLLKFTIVSDDEFGEKSVSVLLDGEESEMIFIDHPSTEMSVSLYLVHKIISLAVPRLVKNNKPSVSCTKIHAKKT